jgi:hypothetical protein
VASSVGFVFDSGDREWMRMRDRRCLSNNGVEEVNKACTAMLSTYL